MYQIPVENGEFSGVLRQSTYTPSEGQINFTPPLQASAEFLGDIEEVTGVEFTHQVTARDSTSPGSPERSVYKYRITGMGPHPEVSQIPVAEECPENLKTALQASAYLLNRSSIVFYSNFEQADF
jgi:hypothetical protein